MTQFVQVIVLSEHKNEFDHFEFTKIAIIIISDWYQYMYASNNTLRFPKPRKAIKVFKQETMQSWLPSS